jgi:transposase
LDALSRFRHEGSSCRLTLEQQAALQSWITVRLPRSTRTIGAWLEKNHGFNYGRSGLIALLHRLGFDYRKPHKMPRGRRSLFRLVRDLGKPLRVPPSAPPFEFGKRRVNKF